MCTELNKVAIQNLEILDSLDDNIDNYRLIIDGNKLSIADDSYDGIFDLKEFEYPVYFTFNQILNSIRYSNLYKLEGYKTKELIELMDNSIDRISFILESMEEDSNHDNMVDIIDTIDNKYLIAKERALTCSFWKTFETFNDYLDTFCELLLDSEYYLYYRLPNAGDEKIDREIDREKEEEELKDKVTEEVNPNLVYDKNK